jgi:hypothetical protein
MFASIANSQILKARITIPQFGIWEGDAMLDGDTAVTGDTQVIVGNMTLAAHAFRSAPFVGRRGVRLVGGYGGWSTVVKAQAYYEPSGIPISHVLGDVAQACGETLSLIADPRPWIRYVRETMRGARALNQILGQSWWIDIDGTTTNKVRTTTQIQSAFQIEHYDGGRGAFTIAIDSIADWMPGRTFTAPTLDAMQTISSVTIVLDGSTARVEVLTGSKDRLDADLLAMTRETFPSLTFLGTYEYSVRGDGGFDPVDPSLGLPSLSSPEMRIPLATVTLHAGDSVRIRFADGRPWRPELCDAPASSTAITIGNAAPAAAAREGDVITISGPMDVTCSSGTASITKVQWDAAAPTIKTGSGQVSIG